MLLGPKTTIFLSLQWILDDSFKTIVYMMAWIVVDITGISAHVGYLFQDDSIFLRN